MDDSAETLPIPDDSEGIVPPGTETEVPLSELTPGIVPPGTEIEPTASQIDNEITSTDTNDTLVKIESNQSDDSKNITTTTPISLSNIVPADTASVLSLTIDPNILPPPSIECEPSPTDNDIVPPGTENESDEQMDFVSVKEEGNNMKVDSHVPTTCDDKTAKVENNDNGSKSSNPDDNSKTNIKTEPLEDDYIDSAADSPEYPLIPSSERISTDEKLNPSSVVSEG